MYSALVFAQATLATGSRPVFYFPFSPTLGVVQSCMFCIIFLRLQNSRFRKAGSAVSVLLECEAREPLSPFSLAVFSLAPAFRSNMVHRSRSQIIRLFCSLYFSLSVYILFGLSLASFCLRFLAEVLFILKKQKICTVFLSSYRNTSGSSGEREMLWEHEPQASVSTAFSTSPKLSRVFLELDRNTKNMFSISFRKHRDDKKENNLTLIIKM